MLVGGLLFPKSKYLLVKCDVPIQGYPVRRVVGRAVAVNVGLCAGARRQRSRDRSGCLGGCCLRAVRAGGPDDAR